MKLKHKYNTDRPFPKADEYWTFAFYGWLLMEHDNGTLIEVYANYATSNKIRIERVINGNFSGNYDDYIVIGYKIKNEYLRKNEPRPISCYASNKEAINFGFKNFQLKLEFK